MNQPVVSLPDTLASFIESPDNLPQGHIVIRRLADVLKIVTLISEKEEVLDPHQIQQWMNICKAYRAPLTQVSLNGYYENHQPYVTLWHKPQDCLLDVHNHLLAQLLIANHFCRLLEEDGEHFHSSRKTAFTFARTISRRDKIAGLESLPVTPCTPAEYLDLLESNTSSHSNRIQSFIVFIRYALGLRKGITHDSEIYPDRKPQALSEPTDPKQPACSTTVSKISMHTPTQERKLEKSGLNLGEFTSQKELSTKSYNDKRPMDGRSSAEHVLRSKNASKHISMYNQQLMDKWSSLTSFEASCVGKGITHLYRCGKANVNLGYPIQNIELAALLSTMFWFSASFKNALTAKVYETLPAKTRSLVAYVKDRGKGYLLIHSSSPRYKQTHTIYEAFHKTSHVALATGLGIEQIISDHCKSLHNGSKLFTRPESDYINAMKSFIAYMNTRYGCRITIPRISNYFFDIITSIPGSDITCAMMITGREATLGATALHYTSLSGSFLLDIFQQACQLVRKEIQFEFKQHQRNNKRKQALPLQDKMYGSRFRPSTQQVSSLSTQLQTKVRQAKTINPVEFHNALTIYTLAFINFSTGFRAVDNASFTIEEIDLPTGFAVIADKDSDDKYHSRPVWIPDECLSQILAYKKHLSYLLEYTSICLPKVHNQLSLELLSESKPFKEKNEIRLPELFLISDNDNWSSIKPGKYESEIIDIFPFPANCHRHFLRSNLLEMGCSVEVIDAFMGHWERGQEPWAKYSSMNLVEYKLAIQPHITQLLSKCGWVAICRFDK